MRVIAFIQEKGLIERILRHLGLLSELAEHIHISPLSLPLEGTVVYEPFFDDLTQDKLIELMQRAMN